MAKSTMKRRYHPDRDTPYADGQAYAPARTAAHDAVEPRSGSLHGLLIIGNRFGLRRAWFRSIEVRGR